ncbi:MAG: cytochrome c maturation protein CcmE [Acidobacteriota bacterium]
MDAVRIKRFIGVGVVLSAFGYLFFSGMKASQVYYLTVGEYESQAPDLKPGEPFRINGRVQSGSVTRSPEGLDLAFAIYDPAAENTTLSVTYHGVIPDTFMEDSEVVVEGKMHEGTFQAYTLLAKCPSKYEALAEEKEQPAGSTSSPPDPGA